MRLIDADRLKNVDFSECADRMEMLEVIDTQPTTLDIDEIIEKLEEYRKKSTAKERDILNKVGNTHTNASISKAIEIIRDCIHE